MPIYCYKDKNTEKTVEVVRVFSDYDKIPTKEEATELSAEEYTAAEWERVIGGGIKIVRGPNFTGSKGNW